MNTENQFPNDLPVTEQEEEHFKHLVQTAKVDGPITLTCHLKGYLVMDTDYGQVKDVRNKIETLFEAIKHGDAGHAAWLEAAIKAHFTDQPLPEYVDSKKVSAVVTGKVKADIESLKKGALLCERNGHQGDAAQIRELAEEMSSMLAETTQRRVVVDLFRRWWFENIDDSHFFNDLTRVLNITTAELNAEPLPQNLINPPKKYCKECSSSRSGDQCHKCGGVLIVPHSSWEDPALPSVEHIRRQAKALGYAIGVHGTLERDLDLIAMPWTKGAVSAPEFIKELAYNLGGRVAETSDKPVGRFSATIQLDGYYKEIDISVIGPNHKRFYYGEEVNPFSPGIHPMPLRRSDGMMRAVHPMAPHLFEREDASDQK